VKRLEKKYWIPALLMLTACAGPVHGPDKQFSGELHGAVVGAGAGAVTGFQYGAGSGPGALVGAGLGAVAGGIQGFADDEAEENLLKLAADTQREREVAYAHEILSEHYKRRLELHPTRDIYPADLFFYGDEVKLKQGAEILIQEIARLNKNRLPWSRMAVTVYSRASNENSEYAHYLTERRSQEISNWFARVGLNPRRLESRGVIVTAPVLIDPDDTPERYNQAIELIPLDR
jgi:hypothetical protein